MKNKYMAILLGIALSLVLLSGCSAQEASTEEIYGEVTEISKDIITVEIGTMKEREKPEDGEKDFSEDKKKPEDAQSENGQPKGDLQGEGPSENGQPKGDPQGKAPSMLELSGETKEIGITKDTVVKRQSKGHASDESETTQEAAFEDISEGDTLQIILDSNGKASEIVIFSFGMRGGQSEESPDEA